MHPIHSVTVDEGEEEKCNEVICLNTCSYGYTTDSKGCKVIRNIEFIKQFIVPMSNAYKIVNL